MRSLIVEDDAITRKTLRLFLKPYAESDEEECAENVLSRFAAKHKENQPYAMIFLDIGLPGQAGLELLRDLRNWERENKISEPVSVIIISGSSEVNNIQTAYTLGVTRYLMKPIIESELITHLRQLKVISTDV